MDLFLVITLLKTEQTDNGVTQFSFVFGCVCVTRTTRERERERETKTERKKERKKNRNRQMQMQGERLLLPQFFSSLSFACGVMGCRVGSCVLDAATITGQQIDFHQHTHGHDRHHCNHRHHNHHRKHGPESDRTPQSRTREPEQSI